MFNLVPAAPLPLAPPKTSSEAAGSFDAYLEQASERSEPVEEFAGEPPIAAHSNPPAKANDSDRESAMADNAGEAEYDVEDDSTSESPASQEPVAEGPVEETDDDEDAIAAELPVAAVLPQVSMTDVEAKLTVEAAAGKAKDAESGVPASDAAEKKNATHISKPALQADAPVTNSEIQSQTEPAETGVSVTAKEQLPQVETAVAAADETEQALPTERTEDDLEVPTEVVQTISDLLLPL